MRLSLVVSLMLMAATAHAAGVTRLTVSTPSAVVLDGSSNVAPWQCRGVSIDALMVVAASPEHINEVIDRIEDGNVGAWMSNPSGLRFPAPEFKLRIPVTALRCGSRIMEGDLRRALRAAQHTHIEFSFRELRGGIHHDLDAGSYSAAIAGDLSLAGVSRPLEVTVSVERVTRTKFRLRAELPLKMTDFAITPPSALLGLIRARDQLTVRFDLMLEIMPAARSQS